MAATRRVLVSLAMSASLLVGPAVSFQFAQSAFAQAASDASNNFWNDFNHYVRIARMDLAAESAKGLLSQTDNQRLLDLVEGSEYPDFESGLARASRFEQLAGVSQQLSTRLQAAKIDRMRDPARIVGDIKRLADGTRANMNATARLRAAGQFATPHLLSTLTNPQQRRLHPQVMAALVAVGQPAVFPLAIALPKLEPVQRAQVAQVLAEIGYPLALPYLKLVLEDQRIDSNVRSVVQSAADKLSAAAGVPSKSTAAELFLTLAQSHYEHSTATPDGSTVPGFDAVQNKGIMWEYDLKAGLVAVPLPGSIFGDVLAMRAARQVLELEPNNDEALNLWLCANLRRENRRGQEKDPSYPANLLQPQFYLQMSGPLRQHDVLKRALDDGDTMLALEAVAALGNTAGSSALVNRDKAIQPVLRALSFPDRRVRFAAAFVAASATPKEEFSGSHRVVPVLAEAIRQTETKFALVIGPEGDTTNRISAAIRDLGYKVISGKGLEAVADDINSGPGVDLIVSNQSVDGADALRRETDTHYKLAAVPILLLAKPGDVIDLNRRFEKIGRVHVTTESTDAKAIETAVANAGKSYAGQALTSEEANVFATEALQLLKSIAVKRNPAYNPLDAKPSLLQALSDSRVQIVNLAAEVLSELNDADAQRALADLALNDAKPDQRVLALNCLASSASNFGNLLTEPQVQKLLALVKDSKNDVSLAASRAHGALTLPTSHAVQLIVK